jgi:hypothetical protein
VCSPRAEKDRRLRISRRGSRRCWRPTARPPGTGGAPTLGWRRGGAADVQLGVTNFMARFNCSGRQRQRRTGDGGALPTACGSVGAGDGGWGARRREQGLGHTTHDLLVFIGQGAGSAVARTDAEAWRQRTPAESWRRPVRTAGWA